MTSVPAGPGEAIIRTVDLTKVYPGSSVAAVDRLTGIVSQQNTLDRQLTVWEDLYRAPRECSTVHGGRESRHAGRRWDFPCSAITASGAPPAVPA